MRSGIEFFMQKDDEQEFLDFIFTFPNISLIPQYSEDIVFKELKKGDSIESDLYFIWDKTILPKFTIRKINLVNGGTRYEISNHHSLVHYIRSQTYGNMILVAGNLGIATTDQLGEYYYKETHEAIEKLYKKFRTWIRAHYNNDLVCLNENNPLSIFPVNTFWLGKHAKEWLKNNPAYQLKQFPNGKTLFKLK